MKQSVLSFLGFLLYLTGSAQFSYTDSVQHHRSRVDLEFLDSLSSPLPDTVRQHFTGLKYFPVDSSYRVTAAFEKAKKRPNFHFQTKHGKDHPYEYYIYGTLRFTLGGKEYSLNVYASPDVNQRPGMSKYLFLPFTDQTSGDDTYGGGRYLDLEKSKANTWTIDFNYAYLPYCAYGGAYTCPIPPPENYVDTRIEAGEKNLE